MKAEKIASDVYQNEKESCFSENDAHEAIRQLRPNCSSFDVSLIEGKWIFNKFNEPNGLLPPTSEEIYEQLKYQNEISKYYQYAYDRCHEYPDGFEQFDMLWHSINNGENLKDSKWFLAIKEIKEKYPKPNDEPPIKKNK